MKKILLGVLVVAASFGLGLAIYSGTQADETVEPDLPTHQFIQLPSQGRLINIECGQPCAIVSSPDGSAYIALLLDGDTITFTLPE